jgi:Tfp pilus assembly protein PilV
MYWSFFDMPKQYLSIHKTIKATCELSSFLADNKRKYGHSLWFEAHAETQDHLLNTLLKDVAHAQIIAERAYNDFLTKDGPADFFKPERSTLQLIASLDKMGKMLVKSLRATQDSPPRRDSIELWRNAASWFRFRSKVAEQTPEIISEKRKRHCDTFETLLNTWKQNLPTEMERLDETKAANVSRRGFTPGAAAAAAHAGYLSRSTSSETDPLQSVQSRQRPFSQ